MPPPLSSGVKINCLHLLIRFSLGLGKGVVEKQSCNIVLGKNKQTVFEDRWSLIFGKPFNPSETLQYFI